LFSNHGPKKILYLKLCLKILEQACLSGYFVCIWITAPGETVIIETMMVVDKVIGASRQKMPMALEFTNYSLQIALVKKQKGRIFCF